MLHQFAATILLVMMCTLAIGVTEAPASRDLGNKIIVRLVQDANGRDVLALSRRGGIKSIEALVPSLNLYLVKLESGRSVRESISSLSRDALVLYAQPDHPVRFRQSPNDPQFGKQWNLSNSATRADIRAPEAWELSTGGKDKLGSDVVVAVVDGGIDVKHRDLTANLWVNTGEIPGNGIDDDGNGYIDDINGWNAFSSNGKIPADRHGTHVGGIIGAIGNNSTDVAGVSWDIKLMAVAGASGTTSVIAKAYGYVIAQKQLWLSSGGAKGANIVATNSSFGVDLADCGTAEYKVWNDLYDAMGDLGILSAAATANLNIDVDVKGDVPTACASDAIVAVTNTTYNDQKYGSAGYGLKHVDLGAPGTAVVSTLPNNKTGPLTGTSMATPHVAGAIGFLHQVASARFAQLHRSEPRKAIVELKRLLLSTVDVVSDLKDRTVSGGRLNLREAARAISMF